MSKNAVPFCPDLRGAAIVLAFARTIYITVTNEDKMAGRGVR